MLMKKPLKNEQNLKKIYSVRKIMEHQQNKQKQKKLLIIFIIKILLFLQTETLNFVMVQKAKA